MKERIKKWLGIIRLREEIDTRAVALQRAEGEISSLKNQFIELQRDNKYLTMYVKGMLEYFDLNFDREEIKDPSIFYQQPTIPIIKITSRKKNK